MFTLRPRGIKARFPRFFTFFREVYFLLTGNTKASDLKGDQSFLSFVNVCCLIIIFTVVTLSRSKMESPSRAIKS